MFVRIYLYVRIYIYITHIYIHEYTHTGGLIEEDVMCTSREVGAPMHTCVWMYIYGRIYI